MLRIGVAVQKADDQRRRALGSQPVRGRADLHGIHGAQDGAARQDALVHFYNVSAIDQWRGFERLDVVKDCAVRAGYFDGVFEAARGDQPDGRTFPLEYRVRSDRYPVNEPVDFAKIDIASLNRRQHPRGRVRRR
jgi:hypothetical protein